ncbi:MAG: hypothetical protein COS34_12950 [Lysobacterales bacterium CG02_land_8_20_14_3_00_62_12]|nr:MAG: hypothetical protein COS34_12950 [Xanthomonadales bacterium CG02_land_8_20_14_3_00_62_12]
MFCNRGAGRLTATNNALRQALRIVYFTTDPGDNGRLPCVSPPFTQPLVIIGKLFRLPMPAQDSGWRVC